MFPFNFSFVELEEAPATLCILSLKKQWIILLPRMNQIIYLKDDKDEEKKEKKK